MEFAISPRGNDSNDLNCGIRSTCGGNPGMVCPMKSRMICSTGILSSLKELESECYHIEANFPQQTRK